MYFLGDNNVLIKWVKGFVVLYRDINFSDEHIYKNTVHHILKAPVLIDTAVRISDYLNMLLQKL